MLAESTNNADAFPKTLASPDAVILPPTVTRPVLEFNARFDPAGVNIWPPPTLILPAKVALLDTSSISRAVLTPLLPI